MRPLTSKTVSNVGQSIDLAPRSTKCSRKNSVIAHVRKNGIG